MKTFLFLVLCCAGARAQTSPISFFLDNSGGADPISQLQSFPANYAFPNTPVGSSSVIGVRVVNTSTGPVLVSAIGFVSGAIQNSNFANDMELALSLAPGQSQYFHIFYVPTQTGSTTATAQAGVTGNRIVSFSTISGNATSAQLSLSCIAPSATLCNGNVLQPNILTAINFGNVPTTSSTAITFTLFNGTASSINPQQIVTLLTATNNPSTPFKLGTLPQAIAAGASGTFAVTFQPGNTNVQQVTMQVGSSDFLLQGAGTASVVGDISSLTITYTNSTGVNLSAQPATPIDFGSTITGVGANPTLLFTVNNPATTIGPVTVPNITVTGVGFAVSGTNPAPLSIQPGASATFKLVFTPTGTGTYTGTLAIGSRTFSVQGESIASSFPTPSITIDQQPLMSQKQAHVTVQLASAAPTAEIGTLTMQFTPSVANINDDPAVEFVSPTGRQLQVTVNSGAEVAAYNGQSAITFQTGTTAGTITFTLQFPNQAPVTQTYTITPTQVQITSGTAVIQAPNLVVTLTGYDNTYSAGALSFTFYDTTGRVLTPTAISVNATPAFHTYFFGETQMGGAFSVQASFPTSGDPTQVGSVAVTVGNSVGQTSSTQTFP